MLIITIGHLRFKIEHKGIVPQAPFKMEGAIQPTVHDVRSYTYVLDSVYQFWVSKSKEAPLEYYSLKDGLEIIGERSPLKSLAIFEALPANFKKALGAPPDES